jgi:hypothetical protein
MPREMWDEVLRFCPTNSLLEYVSSLPSSYESVYVHLTNSGASQVVAGEQTMACDVLGQCLELGFQGAMEND